MQIFTMWGFWIIVLHLGIWHKVIFQAGEQLFVWGNRPTDKIPPDLRFSGVSFYISQDLSFYFSRVSFYISLTFRYLYFLWQGINQFKAFSEKPKVLWWLQSLLSLVKVTSEPWHRQNISQHFSINIYKLIIYVVAKDKSLKCNIFVYEKFIEN